MSLRIFYVDESYDAKKFCLTAIGIRHADWKDCFARIHQHRQLLNQHHGIFVRKEIHATDFVAGRGRISKTTVNKHERSRIFKGFLSLVAQLPKVMIFNVCLDQAGRPDAQLDAWDRLLNRLERTLLAFEEAEIPYRKKLISEIPPGYEKQEPELTRRLLALAPRAIIIGDEGRQRDITRAYRKMNVYNPIPSQFGKWESGDSTKNIPLARILEDPFFKRSQDSYFVQLADCVAFALLKRETDLTPNIKKHNIHTFFDACLSGVCFKKASPDRLGIVRK
jgi:hypothetical protein